MNNWNNLKYISLIFLVLLSFSLVYGTDDSTPDLDIETAKFSIEQKAVDIGKQIEIYMLSNPEMTLDDLMDDPYFQAIAVQKIGKTGYTAVVDSKTFVIYFHQHESYLAKVFDFKRLACVNAEVIVSHVTKHGGVVIIAVAEA